MLIKEVTAKKIKDSRGEPTIEVSVNGHNASAPSGKSTGKYETSPYRKSINWNIKFLNSLKPNININSFDDLKKIETIIKKKAKLKDVKHFGANALMAFEIAILRALAKEQKKQLWQIINPRARKLPIPVGNVIEGGLHAHNKNRPMFQEFLIIPKSKSAKQNIKIMQKVHRKIKSILQTNTKTDEGAWQTTLNNEEIFSMLSKFNNVRIGTDAAASEFYKKGNYHYKGKILDKTIQIYYIASIMKTFNVLYMEDPLNEEDFKGFSQIVHSSSSLIVGDDLTATSRLKKAIKLKSINAMIIKPNQNGSLLELQEIFHICKKHKIKTIISHRSGETMDDALADLAVGFQADYIKAGIATKWREAKLKRLIEIENSL